MKRQQIIDAARSCLGTPFVHTGRHPGHGLDCSGLIVAVAQVLQYPHTDVKGYTRRPDGKLLDHFKQYMDEIPVDELGPGDVPVMYIGKRRKLPQHVGVLYDDENGIRHIIHANGEAGCLQTVDSMYEPKWKRLTNWGLRFRGLED